MASEAPVKVRLAKAVIASVLFAVAGALIDQFKWISHGSSDARKNRADDWRDNFEAAHKEGLREGLAAFKENRRPAQYSELYPRRAERMGRDV